MSQGGEHGQEDPEHRRDRLSSDPGGTGRDTVIWLMHAMRGAGADLTVVLSDNAVNYAVRGQDPSGLAFGDRRQTNPLRLDHDLAKLAAKGVEVLVTEDDVSERGVDRAELIDGVKLIARTELVKLVRNYDQVWHW